jgi:hypothetical protein
VLRVNSQRRGVRQRPLRRLVALGYGMATDQRAQVRQRPRRKAWRVRGDDRRLVRAQKAIVATAGFFQLVAVLPS